MRLIWFVVVHTELRARARYTYNILTREGLIYCIARAIVLLKSLWSLPFSQAKANDNKGKTNKRANRKKIYPLIVIL